MSKILTNELEPRTSGNQILQPKRCSFKVSNTDNVTNLTSGIITWDKAVWDTNGDFNLATNTFVAPVSGIYCFMFGLRMDAIDTGASYYQIYTRLNQSSSGSDNVGKWTYDPNFSADANYWMFVGSELKQLTAGDEVDMYFTQSGGTTQTDNHKESYFSGYFVG